MVVYSWNSCMVLHGCMGGIAVSLGARGLGRYLLTIRIPRSHLIKSEAQLTSGMEL